MFFNHLINSKTIHTLLVLVLCRSEPFLELQSWRTHHCEAWLSAPLECVVCGIWIFSDALATGTESAGDTLQRENRTVHVVVSCHCHIMYNLHFLWESGDAVSRRQVGGDWVTGVVLLANPLHWWPCVTFQNDDSNVPVTLEAAINQEAPYSGPNWVEDLSFSHS